ncbi:hypothetical protein OS493_028509 [Desmophyllum pertusum]|uniref:Uncharacterized protein n=1 Tax=Desmophyllum pertusum TaxID=174260 RepID=A0A9W9Z9P6_9CNID|nr:hypothetical protein OS493_028509 [Desmophyllum pertusum]
MSDNNVLNNKYFQEYMLVSSKDWNKLQPQEKETQSGGGEAENIDSDLARINHSARSALIYQVQRIRQIDKVIQAIIDRKLKQDELPTGMTLPGLLAKKQKLINKYGNRIMSMGIPPATYYHTQKLQQLQQKQLDAARANAEANRETKTIQQNMLEEQNKNTARLEEILEDSDEDLDMKDGIKEDDEDEEKGLPGFLSRMRNYVTPSKSPQKMQTVEFNANDGKIHVQTPAAPSKPKKQTRGTHAMKQDRKTLRKREKGCLPHQKNNA